MVLLANLLKMASITITPFTNSLLTIIERNLLRLFSYKRYYSCSIACMKNQQKSTNKNYADRPTKGDSASKELNAVEELLAAAKEEKDKLAAYKYADLALEAALKNNMRKKHAEALFIQANILISQGAFNEAMEKNIAALEFFEHSAYPDIEAECWHNLGTIYNFLGEHEKRLEYNQKCYELIKDSDNEQQKMRVLNNIGDTYLCLKDYDKALPYFENNYNIAEDFPKIIALSLLNIGETYFYKKNYKKAYSYFEEAFFHYSNILEINRHVATCEYFMGKIRQNQKRYDEAIALFSSSDKRLTGIPAAKKMNAKVIGCLASTYELNNQTEEALHYYKLHSEVSLAIREEIGMQVIKNMQFKFEARAIEQERKRLKLHNQQLQQAKDKIEIQKIDLEKKSTLLESANQELKNFAHVISHDIKEPVRMIASFSTLLERELAETLTPDSKEYLGIINKSANRMAIFIDEVLRYSTTGTNEESLPKEEVNCNAIIDQIKADFSLKLEETNAKILYDVLPTVLGHKQLLTQVFQNLIANSLKFTRSSVSPIIQITVEEKEGAFLFKFEDNGIGIKKTDLPKIFNLFSKLNSRHTYEGSGIGLSIVQKIIHKNGGSIWVDSIFGEGTTFWFTIPREGSLHDPGGF